MRLLLLVMLMMMMMMIMMGSAVGRGGEGADEKGAFDSALFPGLRCGLECVEHGIGCDGEDACRERYVPAQDGEVEVGVCARGGAVGVGEGDGGGRWVTGGEGELGVGGAGVATRHDCLVGF